MDILEKILNNPELVEKIHSGDLKIIDLRNERLSPKIRGFFVGGFRGKVYKYLLKFIIFLNTSVMFWNTPNIFWYIDRYTFYTFVIIRYISNL